MDSNRLPEGSVQEAYDFALSLFTKGNAKVVRVIEAEIEEIPDDVRRQVKEVVAYSLTNSLKSCRSVARRLELDAARQVSHLSNPEEVCSAVAVVAQALMAAADNRKPERKNLR